MNAASTRMMVDMSKPRSERPMVGLDIEAWRAELGLSKYDAQYALGFRNSNHYNRMCLSQLLDPQLELLLRLFDEHPYPRGWQRLELKELFQMMYGQYLEPFKGTRFEKFASVDLGTRFTKLFNRSSARQYEWLGDDPKRNEDDLKANAVIECILCKLRQMDNPAEVLERVGRRVWALRGIDLDSLHRIPTPDFPPSREKTGRKSQQSKLPQGAAKGPLLPGKLRRPSVSGKGTSKAARAAAKPVNKKSSEKQTPIAALKKAVKAPAKRLPKKK